MDLLRSGNFTLSDPGVAEDGVDIRALLWVKLEHAGYQILELLRVEAWLIAPVVGRPELLVAIQGSEQLVVWVVLASRGEGRVTGLEDEKDDAEGEEVDHLTLVGLTGEDLRSHVAKSANFCCIGTRAISATERLGNAEVDDLDIVRLLIEKNIFELEITMREP